MPSVQHFLKLRKKTIADLQKSIKKVCKTVETSITTISLFEEALDLLVATPGVKKAELKTKFLKPYLDFGTPSAGVLLKLPFMIEVTTEKDFKGLNVNNALQSWVSENTTQGSSIWIMSTPSGKKDKINIQGVYKVVYRTKELTTSPDISEG